MNKKLFSIATTALFVVIVFLSGCEKFDPITSNEIITDELSFVVKDNMTGDLLLDSIYVNQVGLFIGNTTLNNVAHWQWTWGDGTSADTGRLAIHKWFLTGNYEICLKVYDVNWTLLSQTCKPWRVVSGSGYNGIPIFKCLNAVSLGNSKWKVTYGVLRKAIQCTPINQPFIVFSETWGWFPINLSITDTTADGYYKHIDTVDNYEIRKFSYGGNFSANCYATIYPNMPYWSSEFYIQSELKLCCQWINGVPTPLSGLTGLPGTVGDAGLTPVVRMSLNSTADSIYFYFCKDRSATQVSPFWANNLGGINNAISLNNSNYQNWWYVAVKRSYIPLGYTLQFIYGDRPNSAWVLANMSSSYFWNSQYQVLEFKASDLGGDIIIVTPSGKQFQL
jgi:hypothetical protein